MYEQILGGMDLFNALTSEARSTIADCLSMQVHEPGSYILTEGEELGPDARFYIVESGVLECFKDFNGSKQLVKTLKAGSVFGEYALVSKIPRQADVVAKEKSKVLSMARDAFERLMGPIEEILAEKIEEYKKLNEEIQQQHI